MNLSSISLCHVFHSELLNKVSINVSDNSHFGDEFIFTAFVNGIWMLRFFLRVVCFGQGFLKNIFDSFDFLNVQQKYYLGYFQYYLDGLSWFYMNHKLWFITMTHLQNDSFTDMITHLKQQSKYRLVKYRLFERALIGLFKGLKVKSDWIPDWFWPWVTSSDLPWIWPESVVQFRPTTVWQASRLIDWRTKLLTMPSSC